MAQKCAGVTWIEEQYGPRGLAGGSMCLLRWKMLPGGVPENGSDSAYLQSQFLSVSTVYKVLILLTDIYSQQLHQMYLNPRITVYLTMEVATSRRLALYSILLAALSLWGSIMCISISLMTSCLA